MGTTRSGRSRRTVSLGGTRWACCRAVRSLHLYAHACSFPPDHATMPVAPAHRRLHAVCRLPPRVLDGCVPGPCKCPALELAPGPGTNLPCAALLLTAGYFTSRPASKGFIRAATSYLQAARQLEAFMGLPAAGGHGARSLLECFRPSPASFLSASLHTCAVVTPFCSPRRSPHHRRP